MLFTIFIAIPSLHASLTIFPEDHAEDIDLDFTAPLRASIYSLAYMLQGTEKDLPEDVLQIIEDIIYQERNH